VDEFVVVAKESERHGRNYRRKKKKVVCVVALAEEGKVKRFYSIKVIDFSAKSLRPIFEWHISKEGNVITVEWKEYQPLCQDYKIT